MESNEILAVVDSVSTEKGIEKDKDQRSCKIENYENLVGSVVGRMQ